MFELFLKIIFFPIWFPVILVLSILLFVISIIIAVLGFSVFVVFATLFLAAFIIDTNIVWFWTFITNFWSSFMHKNYSKYDWSNFFDF